MFPKCFHFVVLIVTFQLLQGTFSVVYNMHLYVMCFQTYSIPRSILHNSRNDYITQSYSAKLSDDTDEYILFLSTLNYGVQFLKNGSENRLVISNVEQRLNRQFVELVRSCYFDACLGKRNILHYVINN